LAVAASPVRVKPGWSVLSAAWYFSVDGWST
jgi:hypothetical protein